MTGQRRKKRQFYNLQQFLQIHSLPAPSVVCAVTFSHLRKDKVGLGSKFREGQQGWSQPGMVSAPGKFE